MIIKFLLFCVLTSGAVQGSKILIATPMVPRSSSHFYNAIGQLLHERGHSVKIVTPYPPAPSPRGNPEVVEIPIVREFFSSFGDLAFKSRDQNRLVAAYQCYMVHLDFCDAVFKDQVFQEVVNNTKNEQYDLVILSGAYSECFYGLVHVYKAPYVIAHCMGMTQFLSDTVGNPDLPSSIPNLIVPHGSKMNFIERLSNTCTAAAMKLIFNFRYLPSVDKILKLQFGQETPSMVAIEKNASLILVNTDRETSYPRPFPPNVIEIGCLHCKPSQPLSKDLKQFVESSGDLGFIYFSLGSIAKSNSMPTMYRDMFLAAFSKLPLKVLWKYETEITDIPIPNNVKIVKWLPQQDVLGHSKCRLFITHGGLLSIQEAVYLGVPMVALPLFGDHYRNVKLMVESNLGLEVDLENLTEDALLKLLKKVIEDDMFSKAAKRKSVLLKDRLKTVQETTAFWLEYVIRHKSAPHLKLASTDLNIFQYFCLDVFAFTFTVVSLSLYLFIKLIKLLIRGGSVQKNKSD